MAAATLRKLSSRIYRPASPKVADRIVKLFAIDLDGKKREIIGLSGQTLFKALTNHGLIDPVSHPPEDMESCCAECEVSITQEWLGKLSPRSEHEEYVFGRRFRRQVLDKHSRLGCQVVLNPNLEGMDVFWRKYRVQVLNKYSRLGCQVVLNPNLEGMVVAVPEPTPSDVP